jgi:hypothetical protein
MVWIGPLFSRPVLKYLSTTPQFQGGAQAVQTDKTVYKNTY